MTHENGDIKVVKSDNTRVDIDLDKIHIMVSHACKNITGVSESLVEMNSGLQFYDGVTTKDIQSILIRSASDLISLDNPNYQFVASRLLLFALQKQVFGTKWSDGKDIYPRLFDMASANVNRGVYTKEIFDHYTEEEIDTCNGYIRHQRDFDFTYAGLQQIVDKYLVQDRSNGEVFETPQFLYMMIAMTLFQKYNGHGEKDRMWYVKNYYDAISTIKNNIPTPNMDGVSTQ